MHICSSILQVLSNAARGSRCWLGAGRRQSLVGFWPHQQERQQVMQKTTGVNNRNKETDNEKEEDAGGRRAATEPARPSWGSVGMNECQPDKGRWEGSQDTEVCGARGSVM